MKLRKATYLALGALVSVASCSKDAAEPDPIDWSEGEIIFRTSLSDLTATKAQDMTSNSLRSFQVTCFNTIDIKKNTLGFVIPHFENATFIRNSYGDFEALPIENPPGWPDKIRPLKFFAFSPNLEEMGQATLINTTTVDNSSLKFGYIVSSIHVDPDISSQFDFITAQAYGERFKDFPGGYVDLKFKHQLSSVQILAWGANETSSFEIAGIRLVNVGTVGNFDMVSTKDAEGNEIPGHWISGETGKGDVEYVFQPGDNIVTIDSLNHASKDNPISISGNGGAAMLVPMDNGRWGNVSDRRNENKGTYLSVLLRVIDATPTAGKGTQRFPYIDKSQGLNAFEIPVVYLAVDNSGKVTAPGQLYKGDDGKYYTDAAKSKVYAAPQGSTIKEFGWAAVPVDISMKAGARYTYTLDYSYGIGVHPHDIPDYANDQVDQDLILKPGDPIINDKVGVSMSVKGWEVYNVTGTVEVPGS